MRQVASVLNSLSINYVSCNNSHSPGLTPLSSELEEGLADILTFAQAMFGGMNDARDGFASDIEHEKDVDDFF